MHSPSEDLLASQHIQIVQVDRMIHFRLYVTIREMWITLGYIGLVDAVLVDRQHHITFMAMKVMLATITGIQWPTSNSFAIPVVQTRKMRCF